MTSHFLCNYCKNPILDSSKRFHCKICNDLDFCLTCANVSAEAAVHQQEHKPQIIEFEQSLVTENIGFRNLIHVTNVEAGEQLIECVRFKPGAGGNFGPGIYFAEDEECAKFKARHGRGDSYVVVKALVNLGRCLILPRHASNLTEDEVRRLGCDSVKGRRWNEEERNERRGIDPWEFVVFKFGKIEIVDCKVVFREQRSRKIEENMSDEIVFAPQVSINEVLYETRMIGFKICYHATTVWAAMNIKKFGFNPGKRGIFGPAIYVADSPERAHQIGRAAKGAQYSILTLRVNLGRCVFLPGVLARDGAFSDLSGERVKDMQCHSVQGNNLYALYDRSRIEVLGYTAFMNQRDEEIETQTLIEQERKKRREEANRQALAESEDFKRKETERTEFVMGFFKTGDD